MFLDMNKFYCLNLLTAKMSASTGRRFKNAKSWTVKGFSVVTEVDVWNSLGFCMIQQMLEVGPLVLCLF